jgi:DNA-directed RNA polymerase subunit beta'
VSEADCGAAADLPVRWSGDPPAVLIGRTVALEAGTPEVAERPHLKSWQARSIHEVWLRSAVRCRAAGVCQACYGRPTGLGHIPAVGEPVGVDAAQGIVAPLIRAISGDGLDEPALRYLEALLDVAYARAPRSPAVIAPAEGVVRVDDQSGAARLDLPSGEELPLRLRPGTELIVKDGDHLAVGDPVSAGSVNPHRVLHLAGPDRVADLLVGGLVGTLSAAEVSLQHGELLVRTVLSLCRVDDAGDAPMRAGDYVGHQELAALASGGTPVVSATPVVLSCPEVVKQTESWLGAAARGAIPRALVDGALSGEVATFDQPRVRMLVGSPVLHGDLGPGRG